MEGCDVLVVGAGLSGAVAARALADRGLRVMVVERRPFVGGLCHDAPGPEGVPLPDFGPHYFRAHRPEPVAFLGRFTEWRPVVFRVRVQREGVLWPFPIQLATFEQWIGRPSTSEEMERTLAAWRVPCEDPQDSESFVLSRVGWPFFRFFYEGYTRKQWGMEARDLLPSACGRVPIRTTREDRYLDAPFQAMPVEGYTAMVERMLRHPGIEVRRDSEGQEARREVPHRHLVWTGTPEEFFGERPDRLPRRSLRWEREVFQGRRVLEAPQINFPGPEPWTRWIETSQHHGSPGPVTTVIREYPQAFLPGREPLYAIPSRPAEQAFEAWRRRMEAAPGVTFLGRQALYRNLDMDQAVEMALEAVPAIEAAVLTEAGRLAP